MSTEEKIVEAAADTVGKLATSVYSDLAGPAVRRTGDALDTVFKIGLSPVSLLNWGFEHTKAWLVAKLTNRIEKTPTEFQQQPPSQLAVPLVLAISAAADSEELRNLYAELLMKAMDSRTVNEVHPSYASVISQLTPQETLILLSFRPKQSHSIFVDKPNKLRFGAETIEDKFHQHCVDLNLNKPDSDIWLQNMLRLRLLEINVFTDAVFNAGENEYGGRDPSVETQSERHLTMSDYGSAFIEACSPPQGAA
jgi:hypothetical protein